MCGVDSVEDKEKRERFWNDLDKDLDQGGSVRIIIIIIIIIINSYNNNNKNSNNNVVET